MDRSLRRAVLERLAAIEEMTVRGGSPLSVAAARTQLRSITGGWRALLQEHQPDRKGRCPVCSGWLRRRRWPCQVWVTAHEYLIGETPVPSRWPAKKSHPFRRPRRVEVIPRQVEMIPRQPEAPEAADQTGHRSVAEPAGTGPAAADPSPDGPFTSWPSRTAPDGAEAHGVAGAEPEPTLPSVPRDRHS